MANQPLAFEITGSLGVDNVGISSTFVVRTTIESFTLIPPKSSQPQGTKTITNTLVRLSVLLPKTIGKYVNPKRTCRARVKIKGDMEARKFPPNPKGCASVCVDTPLNWQGIFVDG